MISDTYELLKRPLRVNFQKNPIASPLQTTANSSSVKLRGAPCPALLKA